MKSHTLRSSSLRVAIVFSGLIALAFAPQSATAQSTPTALYSLGSTLPTAANEGSHPSGPLVLKSGVLYGTTFTGGSTTTPVASTNYGTIFSVNETSGAFTLVHSFSGDTRSPYDGRSTYAPLIYNPIAGVFFGTAPEGGSGSQGIIFEVNGSTVSSVYGFVANSGEAPYAPVIFNSAGTVLYGVTSSGSTSASPASTASGTIYSCTTNGTATVLQAFNASNSATYGSAPKGGLILGTSASGDTVLYGTTSAGGSGSSGTIFQYDLTNPAFTLLHTFSSTSDGASPIAALVSDANGILYGVTSTGGANGKGTVFSLNPTTQAYSVLYNFSATSGGNPTFNQGLLLGADGNLYGTTNSGGVNGGGTVFACSRTNTGGAGTATFTVLYSFASSGSAATTYGTAPAGSLIQDPSSGLLYGTTSAGGANNQGLVYSISPLSTATPVPVVNSGSATIPYGQAYSYQITVSSGTPLTAYGATNLPAWLAINSATGVISGTPPVVGTFTINLSASNSGGTSTNGATLVLTVSPPVPFSTITNPVGLAFSPGGILNCVNFNGYGSATNAGDVVQVLSNGSTLLSPPFVYNLQNPGYPAFDASGNLYVSETGTGNIYEVTPSGSETTFATGFNAPIGLAFDTNGNLYVAESQGGDIKMVTPGGTISTFVTGFSTPTGLAFDTSGNLYVTNYGGGSVSKITPGKVVTQYSSTGLTNPWQLAFDSNGNLYVANDTVAGTISEIAPGGGTPTTFASGLTTPTGLAFDSIGDLFVSEFNLNQVIEIQAQPGTYTAPPVPVVNAGTATDVYGSVFGGYSITVSSGTPTSYAASGLPAGLSVNPVTGVISGTPTVRVGTYDVTISATNSVGGTGTAVLVLTITPAPLAITANNASMTYGGSLPALSVSYSGLVNGDTSASLTTQPTVTTTATSASSVAGSPYPVTASGAVDANYTISYTAGALTVTPATAVLAVSGYGVVYNGGSHMATATANGVSGPLPLSDFNLAGTVHTNAGTYNGDSWSFADPSGNYYAASGTVNDSITAATVTVNVTGYALAYDGNSHTASATVAWSGGSLPSTDVNLTGTTHTVAGTYATDPWSFSDSSGNFAATSGTTSDSITPAAVSVTVTPYNVTYDGNTHTASATVNWAGGSLPPSDVNLSGTSHQNAGTYSSDAWSFSDASGNFAATSGTTSDSIAPAAVTVTVTGYTVTFDGNPHTASATVAWAGGALPAGDVNVAGTTHTTAGSYSADSWSFSDASGNFAATNGTVNDLINKATPTITWANPTDIIWGTALSGTQLNATSATPGTFAYTPASGTILSVGPSQSLNVVLTPTDTTDYNNAAATVLINVDYATATVTLGDLLQTYDGTAKNATATTNPGGLTVLFAYNGVPEAVSPTAGSIAAYAPAIGQTIYVSVTGDTSGAVYGSGPYAINSDIGAAAVQAGVLTSGQTAVLQVTVLADQGTYAGSTQNGVTSVAEGAAGGSFQIVGVASPSAYTLGPVHAGSTPVTATIVSSDYAGAASDNLVITPATPVLSWAQPADIYYGTALGATQLDPTASVAGTFSFSPASGTVLNVGQAQPLNATFTPTDAVDYVSGGTVATVINVDSTVATITMPPVVQTYTGSPVGDTATVVQTVQGISYVYTGTGNTTYGPSSTPPTNAGTYSVTATINDPTYTGSATATITIGQATPVITVTPYAAPYTGSPYTATGTATGVGGVALSGLNLSGTTHTAVGTYTGDTWIFTDSTGNYVNSSGTVNDSIVPASVQVTVNSATVTYNGQPQSVTTSTTPGGVALTVTYNGSSVLPTTPGTYAVVATVSSGNYTGSGTGTLVICKANPTITVTGYAVTFSGSPYTATGSAKGVGGVPLTGLNLSGTTHTNAGTYNGDTWTFTDTTGDYNNASGTVNDSIAAEAVTVTVDSATVTYNGQPQSVLATAFPVGPGLALTYNGSPTAPTAPGTYTVVATVAGTNNYTGSGTGTLIICKATPTISVTPYSVTYTGSAFTATGSATGVGGVALSGLNLSGTTHTNVGTYNGDAWTFTDTTGDYTNASGTVNDAISAASATVTVNSATVTYNGQPQSATTSTTPAGLALTVTYNGSPTVPTVPGTYTVVATISGGNYTGSGTGTLIICKATPTISVTGYSVTYTGSAFTATGSATGVGGVALSGLNLSGTTHTNAGTYNGDAWTFTDTTGDYTNASGTVNDSIAPASATVKVNNATVTYSGQPQSVTTSTTPTGLSLTVTYNGSATVPTAPGTYTVVATVTGGNYTGSGTGTLIIGKATPTISVTGYSVTYTGSAFTATGSAKGVGGVALSGLNLSGTTHTSAGTYNGDAWTFTDTTGDYNNASGTVNDSIAPATVTVTVNSATVTYNGSPQSVTASASTSGLTLTLTYNGSATAPTSAGTYTVVATVSGNGNYTGSGTGTLVINKATPTLAWATPAAITYGTALGSGQLDATSSVAGSFAYTPASGAVLAAGAGQKLGAVFTPTDTNDYVSGGTVSTTITVNKAPLTVAASNQSISAGQAIPTLTYTITGFVNGDTQATAVSGTPSVTTTATSSSAAGTYTITVAQGTLAAANYSFTFVNGTLTITASTAECLVWLQGNCGDQTICNGGGYNNCGGYNSFYNYCNSGGYCSSQTNQTVIGGTVVPVAFALYNCSNSSYRCGSSYGAGCNGQFVVDTSTVISIYEVYANGTSSDPVSYGYSATGPNPPNYWILNNEYLLNFPTASGTHHYVVEVDHPQANGSLTLLGTETIYTVSSCLPSPCSGGTKFNSSKIAAGSTIWFNSVVNVGCSSSQTSMLIFDSSTITFTANGSTVTLNVPAATIKFDPGATTATTTYDATANSWATVLPAGYSGNVFLTGVGYPVTTAIAGGINPVTWTGSFRCDNGSANAQWQWGAAVYSQFNTNPAALGVKPVDSSTLSQYKNSDLAGTPETYKQYLVAGACGTGGSNYTGTRLACGQAQLGSGCWSNANYFSDWWYTGSCSGFNINSGGGWGNGGSGGSSCANGGDGTCDGGWGGGWDNYGNNSCSNSYQWWNYNGW